jgi:protein-tyrosine phosphatase
VLETQAMKPRIVLFLCTGNYYRSRFAGLLFNHRAQLLHLHWRAISRGLALEFGVNNVGSISQDTLAGLAVRGIAVEPEVRPPLTLNENDLTGADRIIAVNRDEHLPILERKFPHCVKQVEFWQVYDSDVVIPDEALAQLERNVLGLINRLYVADPTLRLPTE